MAPRLTTRLVLFVVALGFATLVGADWTATLAARPLPHAQASLAANGEVIVAYQRYAGKFALMSPSGGAVTYVDCGGDLTYAGTPRFFLNWVAGTNLIATTHFGSGGLYSNIELAVSDEDCAQPTVMTHEGNMIFGGSRWSPDGTMVAVFAHQFDLATGLLVRQGIFVADVVYDSGRRPASLTNLRLVVSPVGENFAWAPDSQQLVYVDAGTNGADLFVCSLDGASINITNTPNVAEDQPAWSATGRIAYTRQTSDPKGGSSRYDIFTIPAAGGSEVQITSKATTGSFINMSPSYSPDGQQILFSSTGTVQGDRALYRIRADGAGKATKVVGGRNEDWRLSFWRR